VKLNFDMLANHSTPWCSIITCNGTRLGASLIGDNSSNSASCDSNRHFCVRVLHDTINQTKYVDNWWCIKKYTWPSSVRYVDILILVPTFLCFVFLTWCLLRQWRIITKRPLCTILFVFVYMITISGVVCKAVSMSTSYKNDSYKVYCLVWLHQLLVQQRCVRWCYVAPY